MSHAFVISLILLSFFKSIKIPYEHIEPQKINPDYNIPRLKANSLVIFPYQGIHLSSVGAARIDEFLEKFDEAGLNCIVIAFKEALGTVDYNTEVKFAKQIGARYPIIKIDTLIKKCKAHRIYIIARIVVFKDSVLAYYNNGQFAIKEQGGGIWKDDKGRLWVDPYSRKAWQYNIEIAKELARKGVDEIQFDYIRFPSSKRLESAYFSYKRQGDSRERALVEFLRRAREELIPFGVTVSGDVYGYTIWLERLECEGQNLERMSKHLDVVYPMLYPSHFHDDFKWTEDPRDREYDILYESIMRAKERVGKNKFVAYIQGFNLKSPDFGPDYILNQIEAVRDAHALGFIVWNARNNYKPLWDCLKVLY
jgi:hypothetical protein